MAALSNDALCWVFRWLNKIDPAALACDVPRVCRRWANVCRMHSCGATIHVHLRTQKTWYLHLLKNISQEIELLPGLESAVASVRAIASRHHVSRVVIAQVTGGCSPTELTFIIGAIGSMLAGLNVMALVSSAEINRPIEADRAVIALLASQCSQLVHIGLSGMLGSARRVIRQHDADNGLLEMIGAAFPNLETLAVRGWHLTAPALASLAGCKRLSWLDLGDLNKRKIADEAVDAAVATLLHELPRLRLDAVRVRGKGDKSYAAEGKKFGPRKHTLTVTGHDIATTLGIVSLLKTCPMIQHARLCASWLMPSAPFDALKGAAATLTHLELHGDGYEHFTASGLVSLVRGCTNVVRLAIVDCPRCDETVLKAIQTTIAPRLLELKLKSIYAAIGFVEYKALFEQCKSLERLELIAVGNLWPSHVETLPLHCPRLETLVLRQCIDLLNVRMEALAPLEHLRTLEVDHAIRHDTVAWDWLPHLTTLRVECVVTDYMVASIMRDMPNLEELSLLLTLHGHLSYRAFVNGAAKLKWLVLDNADGLTGAILFGIVRALPALRFLDLARVRSVPAAELYQLALAYPELHIFNEVLQESCYVLAPRARRDRVPLRPHQWSFDYCWESKCW
jgi:hypothetical protein